MRHISTMNRLSIGLLCPEDHPIGSHLRALLEDRNAAVLHVNLSALPQGSPFTIRVEGIFAGDVALDALDALWIPEGEYMSGVPAWVPPRSQWPDLRTSFPSALRHHQETRAFRSSLLLLLSERVPLVNPALAYRACLMQPWLLRCLARRGVPVAPFVSGNDLEQIARFVDDAEQNCRVRRLLQHPRDEKVANFAYLKAHHEDLDHFPWIVRQHLGGQRYETWVIGGHCIGGHCIGGTCIGGTCIGANCVEKKEDQRWLSSAELQDQVASLACRCAQLAGLPLCVVGIETDGSGKPWLIDVDGRADPEELGAQVRGSILDRLADTLIELSGTKGPLPSPSFSEGGAHIPGPKKRVGISGRVADAEVRAVAKSIELRGGTAVPIEIPLFPSKRALHECEGGGRIGTQDLASLDALYLRQTGYSSPLPDPDEGPVDEDTWNGLYEAYARVPRDEGESFLFKYSLLHILGERVAVINPPNAQEVHRNKVWQLFTLASQGVPVPPTLAGNDRAQCEAFIRDQGGADQVVVKPLAGIYKTRLLSEVGLEPALASGPVILQRYVRGDTIRTYLVDGKLIGAGKILHDGRAVDSSLGQTGVEVVALSEEAISDGWKAACGLGLSWTGMDFIREKATGRCFVLECNASSMFANFSRMTGCDVPGALASLLLDGSEES